EVGGGAGVGRETGEFAAARRVVGRGEAALILGRPTPRPCRGVLDANPCTPGYGPGVGQPGGTTRSREPRAMDPGLVTPGDYPLPRTPGYGPGVGQPGGTTRSREPRAMDPGLVTPGGLPAPVNPGPWARGRSPRATTRSREPRAMDRRWSPRGTTRSLEPRAVGPGSAALPASRPQLVQRPRKRDRLADVGNPADPRHRALDAEPEARMDERPILP